MLSICPLPMVDLAIHDFTIKRGFSVEHVASLCLEIFGLISFANLFL